MPRGCVWPERATVRSLLTRHLVGTGVELGPGHEPFPVPFGATAVAYVDRWTAAENAARFPELGGPSAFADPDLVCDLDVDRLKPLGDGSQDFVIASHVLEHVADPLGLLDEVHRVLRPGGSVVILLPDRRRTFDAGRPPTTVEHLVDHHTRGITEVDDDHIREYISFVEPPAVRAAFAAASPEEQQTMLAAQRERSIHAHCWQEDEFAAVLVHAVAALGHEWELVDGLVADDEGPDGVEFGYVLRRDSVAGRLSPSERAARFAAVWDAWVACRRDWLAEVRNLHAATEAQRLKGWSGALKDVARPVVDPVRQVLGR